MITGIKDLNFPEEDNVNLRIIDNWLHSLAGLTPEPADPHYHIQQEHELHTSAASDPRLADFHTHTLNSPSCTQISATEVRNMAGFRQLLQACARNNVRIDIATLGADRMKISFEPDETFLRSSVFGRSCAHEIPTALTQRLWRMNGQ